MTTTSNLSIFSDLLKTASGSIIGAAATYSWSGAASGALTAVTMTTLRTPKEILITAVAFAAIKLSVDKFIWDQTIFSLVASTIPMLLINKRTTMDILHFVDMSLVGSYGVLLINYLARYHLGKTALIATPLLIGGLFCAKTTSTKPKPPFLEKVVNPDQFFLSDALLEKAKAYIDSPEKLKDLPRSPLGKIPVYFLDELVLKRTGSPENQHRLMKMKQAKRKCLQNGFEDLAIPEARIYKKYIIESRLPLAHTGTKEQIGLYIEHRDQFTNAIKEFTELLFQSSLPLLISLENDLYISLSETPMGRYDNIALFLENGRGKLGLVDLERFTELEAAFERFQPRKIDGLLGDLNTKIHRSCPSVLTKWLKIPPRRGFMDQLKVGIDKCCELIILFPYHFDEIMSIAKKYFPEVERFQPQFKAKRDGALKRFKLVYEDHLEFINAKSITVPDAFERPKADALKQIQDAIGTKICKEFDSEVDLVRFNQEAFPEIMDETCTLIEQLLQSSCSGKHPSNRSELLALRTFEVPGLEYYSFIQAISSKLEMFAFDEAYKKEQFAGQLGDCIFKNLAKAKVIAYYNPKLGPNNQRYIFC